MENGQNTKKDKGKEPRADTSDGSTKLPSSESMPLGASKNSKPSTPATTLKGSVKIWKSADLKALELKAGLVAGALADFQAKGGLIKMDQVTYNKASGTNKGIKLFLVVKDADLVAEKTPDGMDFRLVAESESKE